MNTDNFEKLYRENLNDATPDFWNKIDAGLKPHSELTEEEKSSLTQFENLPDNNDTDHVSKPADLNAYRKARRRKIFGWAAAAAVFVFCIPAMIVMLSARGKTAAETAAAEAAYIAEAEAACIAEAEAPAKGAQEEAVPEEAAPADFYMAETRAAAKTADEPEAVLLSVPADAITQPADTVYFTEEVLAETDMLVIADVTSAEFEFNSEGRAYRLSYTVTVRDSLLDDGESGKAGNELRIVSPIVSDGMPDGEVLYQLVPGQTYILPLKKNTGDWELVCPYAPQILMHENGSFEFHTGYTSLINDDTEVVFDVQASDDDFWFDRKVSRDDADFIGDLTELVKFIKNK